MCLTGSMFRTEGDLKKSDAGGGQGRVCVSSVARLGKIFHPTLGEEIFLEQMCCSFNANELC